MGAKNPPRIPLPKSWTQHLRLAMLRIVALAQDATAYTRSWAIDVICTRVRAEALRFFNGRGCVVNRQDSDKRHLHVGMRVRVSIH